MVYEDLLLELNRNKVDYVVIGGVALVLHGVVRLTVDLDLMLSMDEKNLKKLLVVMEKLGYKPNLPIEGDELLDSSKRDEWVKNKNMLAFSFINPASALALVDIMVNQPVDYKELKKHCVEIGLRDIKIPVASVADLIKLKKISAREQDMADIEALKKIVNEYGK